MSERAIAVFDSGVGGLTVAKEVLSQLPQEHLIYLGDTLRVPYGPRELTEVREFVLEIVDYLQSLNVKLIVIACNTGTAAGLEDAQLHSSVPVIGVIEPGAKAAVDGTTTGRIGVIATEGTVDSGSYRRTLGYLSPESEVISVACPPFVDFVERGEVEGERLLEAVEWYLRPLKEAEVDTLILGCTHYPLLEQPIAMVMGPEVRLISSAMATAKETKAVLDAEGLLNRNAPPATRRFLSTGNPESFLHLGSRFLGRRIDQVEQVTTSSKKTQAVFVGPQDKRQ